MADYIRARSPEQKQERMEAIMAAADALFQQHPYHQITMGTIAEQLGWSRSNLYKYAATQEEIFLALHSAKNRAWLGALAAALASAPLPHAEFARIWAATTDEHGGFLRYQEILISIFESNVTLERLTEFKREFAEMAPGMYNHFHCAELTREAMRAAGLAEPVGSFEDEYADFTLMCLLHAANQG